MKEFQEKKVEVEMLVNPANVVVVQATNAKAERTSRWMSVEEFKKASFGSCFRPDIYLNSGRKCDKCPNTGFCSCYLNRGVAAKTRIDEDDIP